MSFYTRVYALAYYLCFCEQETGLLPDVNLATSIRTSHRCSNAYKCQYLGNSVKWHGLAALMPVRT